jgi:hypothetical protein
MAALFRALRKLKNDVITPVSMSDIVRPCRTAFAQPQKSGCKTAAF